MTILLISDKGRMVGLGTRLQNEGHGVTLVLTNKKHWKDGDGFVGDRRRVAACLISTILPIAKSVKPDLVVFETSGYGVVGSMLRKHRYPVFGSSIWADKFEENWTEVARSFGLSPASGDVEWETEWWFDGISNWCHNRVVKKTRAMTGDLGPKVECSMALLKPTQESRALEEPINMILRRLDYRGPVALGWNKEGVVGLRLGIGWDNLPALSELMRLPIGEIMQRTVMGAIVPGALYAGTAVSLRMYSMEAEEKVEGLEEKSLKHSWIVSLQAGVESCGTPHLLTLTARGVDGREAVRRVYRTTRFLRTKSAFWRTDLGDFNSQYERF